MDPDMLHKAYKLLEQAEIDRQVRKEWAIAWRQAEKPEYKGLVKFGDPAGHPYRTVPIVKVESHQAPWYLR